jgi:hypothetical protein
MWSCSDGSVSRCEILCWHVGSMLHSKGCYERRHVGLLRESSDRFQGTLSILHSSSAPSYPCHLLSMSPEASTPGCRRSAPHPAIATHREGGRTRRTRCTDLDHVVASLLRFAPTLLSLAGSDAVVVRETSNTTPSHPRRVLNPLTPSSLYGRCRDRPWAQVRVRRLLLPPPADLAWARRWLLLLLVPDRGR